MKLIDEIEADAVLYSDACDLMQTDYWSRIRAYLLLADEMAQHAQSMANDVGLPPAVADWLARFRAATEGTK